MNDSDEIVKLRDRVKTLEDWRHTVDTRHAVEDEREFHLNIRFDKLEGRLDRIDQHMGKIIWLIIGSIISGIMAFILTGGLTIGV